MKNLWIPQFLIFDKVEALIDSYIGFMKWLSKKFSVHLSVSNLLFVSVFINLLIMATSLPPLAFRIGIRVSFCYHP